MVKLSLPICRLSISASTSQRSQSQLFAFGHSTLLIIAAAIFTFMRFLFTLCSLSLDRIELVVQHL